MKQTAYLLVLILLALASGCDTTDPDIPASGWKEYTGYDFPVYVGNMADYMHTDASGNLIGTVDYGEGGDDRDWQVFEYTTGKHSSSVFMPKVPQPRPHSKETYNVCVEAFDLYGNGDISADILFDGTASGFTTPHTFTHEGAYDPTLKSRYFVHLFGFIFMQDPLEVYDADANTYTFTYQGWYEPIIPPWNSFVATVTEQNHVRLSWTTYSETDMQGFRIYRNDTNDILSALPINPVLISATNTCNEYTYSYTDPEVEPGVTYYYWMEFVYIDNPSQFHGPISITMPPATNRVSYAYPNPCTDMFRLDTDVIAGTNATLLLLDSQREIRKTLSLEAGYHHLQVEVGDLEPGLYRVFIWFSDSHYVYGDVLIQD